MFSIKLSNHNVFDLKSFSTKKSCHLRSVFIPSQIRIRGFAALHAVYRKIILTRIGFTHVLFKKCWTVKKFHFRMYLMIFTF